MPPAPAAHPDRAATRKVPHSRGKRLHRLASLLQIGLQRLGLLVRAAQVGFQLCGLLRAFLQGGHDVRMLTLQGIELRIALAE